MTLKSINIFIYIKKFVNIEKCKKNIKLLLFYIKK